PQIRNRGTLGGNLGTASPAGDSLPVLAAHDAEVVLISAARGERSVPWDAFLVGVKRTSARPDELILGARWRALGGPQSFSKVGTRNAMVIAVVSLCFALDPEARTARVALGSVAPTVVRAPEAEAFLAAAFEDAGVWDDPGAPVPGGTVEAFAERVVAATRPIDDVRGSAAYRRHAVRVLAQRALRWAAASERRVEGGRRLAGLEPAVRPSRGARAPRLQERVRAGRVRVVHGLAGRRARLLVPGARGAGPRADGAHRRVALRGRPAPSRAGGVPRGGGGAVRLLHPGSGGR